MGRRKAMSAPATSSEVSVENNTLLLRLSDGVKGLTSNVDNFIEAQEAENRRIHSRIDAASETHSRQVGEIKDALNQRGRVTGQSVLSFVAVGLSTVALIFGFGHSYVSMRIDGIIPQIQTVDRAVSSLEQGLKEVRQEQVQSAIKQAHFEGRTEARFEYETK